MSTIREGLLQAVEDEIREARHRLGQLGHLRLIVEAGRVLEATPGAYVYQFSCDLVDQGGEDKSLESSGPYQIPEDTTGVLVAAEGGYVPTVVIAHDPIQREVLLELQVYAPLPHPERAELTFSSMFLLMGLQARLGECLQSASMSLLHAALGGHGQQLSHATSALPPGLGRDQAEAIRFALGNSVTFLWGPPGTGKTRTLAHLICELLEAKETVLLTANTNVAVDRLVESTLDVLGSPARPPLLRLGRLGRGLRGRGVSTHEVLNRNEGFADASTRFETMVRDLGIPTPSKWNVDTLLRLAGWVLTAQEVLTCQFGPGTVLGLIDMARAIGASAEAVDVPAMATTLCGTYTRPELRTRRFDTIVVDEASMASVAHFTAAASVATRRVVIAGDFQQLPPIVLARTPEARRFLGQHMFSFAGCDDVTRDHPKRRMLREQWRMHPEIRHIVSRVFYGERLTDSPAIADRRAAGRGGVLVVDTHGCQPKTVRTPSHSLRNTIHAALIAEWLADCAWESIGVIAPYRAQARAIRKAVRGRCRDRLDDGSIQASTVHKFQGEERDLIIFDTTDAPEVAGHFLNDTRNPSAANLVNVALSRAKYALLIVGDVPYLRARLGRDSSVGRVLTCALGVREGQEVDASDPNDRALLCRFLRAGES
jgi:hypothetical protein